MVTIMVMGYGYDHGYYPYLWMSNIVMVLVFTRVEPVRRSPFIIFYLTPFHWLSHSALENF